MTKTYSLIREQSIARPLDDVFAFFADARNLETLTPPWLRFQILTPGDIDMHAGAIIQYALQVHGLPVHWTTAIAAWKPPYEFVDVQLRGPYVLWHHRHTFTAEGGSTRMLDEVNYALPFGPLGRAAHYLFVRRDLEQIFDYRANKIAQIFGHANLKNDEAARRPGPQFATGFSS
jgi:ligand-binding SRPBCC domain-containing protein